jgi:WS/DGAT/MGAT family acyltransferase
MRRLCGIFGLGLALTAGCAPLAPGPRAGPSARIDPGRPREAALQAGLAEALELASRRAVGRTARDGGFRDHARIRLRLPRQLDGMAAALRPMGMGGPMNVLELAMNRAAERAAAQALPHAIERLRFDDPAAVLEGPEDAATRAFRARAGPELERRFEPVVDDSMRQVGLLQAYDQLLAHYRALPSYRDPDLDLVAYVTRATLDGLFSVLAEEERRIRREPEARKGERLQRLFGGADPAGARVRDPRILSGRRHGAEAPLELRARPGAEGAGRRVLGALQHGRRVVEAEPLDRVVERVEFDLRRAPRFRQRLDRVPVTGHPIWVDDDRFNLLYHVRHTSLPVPGDERRLKRLVGRIMSQGLDPTRPMWELWFVEGLEQGRFAVISKVHHALIDGISGVDLLSAFMGPSPDYEPDASDHRWIPRPPPGAVSLLADEAARRAATPFRAVRGLAKALSSPGRSLDAATHAGAGFVRAMSSSLKPASETPFNVEIGPHRRFDWTRFDLGVVREVKQKLGGTVNDVALTCVAGAVRSHLLAHQIDVSQIDFRVLIPVSTRRPEERGKLGNRVSLLVAHLPVDEPDLRRRSRRVIAETRRLKESGEIEGTQAFEEISDWTASGMLSGLSRLAAARRSYNMVVTNVPGPQVPVYLAGARMQASYPLVPLFENQALGEALFSYDEGLHWGFNADWDAVPDLHEFALGIEHEFEALRKL